MEVATTELERVQARLAKLEQDHRNLKWSVLSLLVGLLMLLWITEKRGRTWIEAESFVIKDKHGVTRGIFSTIDEYTFIKLHGMDGEVQAEVQAAPFGPFFALYNTEGKVAARLSLSPRGTNLDFFDAEQKSRVAMTTGLKGTLLRLLDENGTGRITLGVQPSSGEAESSQEQQSYFLVITDKEGKPLFTAPHPTP